MKALSPGSAAVVMTAIFSLVAPPAWAEGSTVLRPTRAAVLHDTAVKVIVPASEELLRKARALTNSVGHLIQSPSSNTLVQALMAWTQTMFAARAVQGYEAGPLTDRDAAPAFFYSQILPNRITSVLSSTQPIDLAFIEELGSPAKGMFALEFLLFGQRPAEASAAKPASPLDTLAGPQGSRLATYLRLLAEDIETRSRQLPADWVGPEGAAKKFVAAGQESINTLVNQLAAHLELVAENRLGLVLRLPEPISRQYHRVECSPSGTSQQSCRALVDGIRQLYLGGEGAGLDDLVAQLNPALARRIDAQFTATLSAIDALAGPLEDAILKDRAALQTAFDKARALEILFKVDVASTLGVTITFGSNDGD